MRGQRNYGNKKNEKEKTAGLGELDHQTREHDQKKKKKKKKKNKKPK